MLILVFRRPVAGPPGRILDHYIVNPDLAGPVFGFPVAGPPGLCLVSAGGGGHGTPYNQGDRLDFSVENTESNFKS